MLNFYIVDPHGNRLKFLEEIVEAAAGGAGLNQPDRHWPQPQESLSEITAEVAHYGPLLGVLDTLGNC